MKTLILNGSPRPNGDTAVLVKALRERLEGEVVEIHCYHENISPCIDCRYCVKHSGCAVKDDMQALYPVIESCDNIVIASPVYFSQPTPPVLSVASRLQPYFCAKAFRGENPEIRPKRGGILLAGGGSGSADPAVVTARMLLRCMRAKEIGPVVSSLATDKIIAADDPTVAGQAEALAAFLNRDDG